MPVLNGSVLGSTPILTLSSDQLAPWDKVWGATYLQKEGKWAFPAYFPFVDWVVKDLTAVGSTPTDASAEAFIRAARITGSLWAEAEAQYATKEEVILPLPKDHIFHGPPLFAHQRMGLAKAYAYYRMLLLWEMGTGKTRVIIELLRWLKAIGCVKRVLVVCPRVVLPTWERQVLEYGGGELTCIDLTHGDRDKRIQEANAADVVLTTYGIARSEYKSAVNHVLPEDWKVGGAASDKALKRKLTALAKANPALYDKTMKTLQTGGVPPSDIFTLIDYDVVVFDEGHVLGTYDSEVTKACLQLSTKAARRYILTGTAGNDPLKYYSLLRILHPWLEKRPFWQFKQHHTEQDPYNKYLILGWKNLHEINAKVNLIASRMKKSECLDLPPVVVSDVLFSLQPKQKVRYNQLVEEMSASESPFTRHLPVVDNATDNTILSIAHGAVRVNKLLQITSGFLIIEPDKTICNGCEYLQGCVDSGINPYTKDCKVQPTYPPRKILRDVENPKLEVFKDLAENILEEDSSNKLIVWATYLPELDDLEAVCKENKWTYVRVDGSNTNKIASIEKEFQTNPGCRIYLGQVSSGIGVTLTAANYTIYYSLPWDRTTYRQSFDRNVRIGQTRHVTVYRLLGKDTLDEFVSRTLNYKDTLAYTLSEKVACAPCEWKTKCGIAEVRPFQPGCKYQSTVDRPVARAAIVK
jgi:SNF2 family DNA or RNA helicase